MHQNATSSHPHQILVPPFPVSFWTLQPVHERTSSQTWEVLPMLRKRVRGDASMTIGAPSVVVELVPNWLQRHER